MIGTASYANDEISSCHHHHRRHLNELATGFDHIMTEPQSSPSNLHDQSMMVDDQSPSRSFQFGKSPPHPTSPHISTKTLPIKKRRPSSSKCTVRATKHVLAITSRALADCGRRRVRFQQDPVSRRVVRRVIYGRVTMTEEERKAFWWDSQRLRKSSRHAIRMYMQNAHLEGVPKQEFEHNYRQALRLCSSNCADMTDIPMLSDTSIRGLEHKIFPESIISRQEVIRKVVAAQHKLPKQLAPEQQSKLLRAASQNLTRSSRMLARLYGIGDATVAAVDMI
jgi:hypothetical protein